MHFFSIFLTTLLVSVVNAAPIDTVTPPTDGPTAVSANGTLVGVLPQYSISYFSDANCRNFLGTVSASTNNCNNINGAGSISVSNLGGGELNAFNGHGGPCANARGKKPFAVPAKCGTDQGCFSTPGTNWIRLNTEASCFT